MITDVENVIIQIYVELAMAPVWFGNGHLHKFVVYVFAKMFSWLHCLVLLHWDSFGVRGFRIVLPLQWRSAFRDSFNICRIFRHAYR